MIYIFVTVPHKISLVFLIIFDQYNNQTATAVGTQKMRDEIVEICFVTCVELE